ncbi:uncharacterized protein Z518_02400 [Rhinocladiella mackenziei CBS 650.93]|uniref:Glucose-inducible SAM-dependent methyltransferase Rrg1 n=1 Tax=Rhinocladiella mackenziei CBS 650.93 TaxID=1442369 RepID=A0A0D2IWK2_9EURO|nr:uncharacterized protein Z518_02400 [Rhinocladiella mackenziei CBS 650.93]KIX07746.1 hypothetical protein Z518_02400 [Rhinocladiella mackenziei CBS 650.93]
MGSGPADAILRHVYDLPQLYQKPSASALLHALGLLSSDAPNFSITNNVSRRPVEEQGVPRYLTSIVSSSLNWIEDEAVKDSIWNAASTRLSERSGRNAMPPMTRSFIVQGDLTVSLHEPSLTEDNLGLKTWTSSLMLSRRLAEFRRFIPHRRPRVLELGAGTGLVGISAACIWHTHVQLTDLPEIVPNLQRNLEQNRGLVEKNHGSVDARALDWADEIDRPSNDPERFPVILAADPIYSPEHPELLVSTIRRWICRDIEARFIVGLPLRDRYEGERQGLRENLQKKAFDLIVEGTDSGFDDWHDQDGNPAEVVCWWSVWKPSDLA